MVVNKRSLRAGDCLFDCMKLLDDLDARSTSHDHIDSAAQVATSAI